MKQLLLPLCVAAISVTSNAQSVGIVEIATRAAIAITDKPTPSPVVVPDDGPTPEPFRMESVLEIKPTPTKCTGPQCQVQQQPIPTLQQPTPTKTTRRRRWILRR